MDRAVTGELGLRRTGDKRFVCFSFPWQYLLPCCDAAGNILILGSRLLWSQVAQQGAGAARWPGMLHSCSHRTLDTDWAGSNVYLSGYKASPRISKQQRAPPAVFYSHAQGRKVSPRTDGDAISSPLCSDDTSVTQPGLVPALRLDAKGFPLGKAASRSMSQCCRVPQFWLLFPILTTKQMLKPHVCVRK